MLDRPATRNVGALTGSTLNYKGASAAMAGTALLTGTADQPGSQAALTAWVGGLVLGQRMDDENDQEDRPGSRCISQVFPTSGDARCDLPLP